MFMRRCMSVVGAKRVATVVSSSFMRHAIKDVGTTPPAVDTDDVFARIVDDHLQKQTTSGGKTIERVSSNVDNNTKELTFNIPDTYSTIDSCEQAASQALEKECDVSSVLSMGDFLDGLKYRTPGEVGGGKPQRSTYKADQGAKTQYTGKVGGAHFRCRHGRRLRECRDCAPADSFCEHKKLKATCYKCRPAKFRLIARKKDQKYRTKCEHRIPLRFCLDCAGQGICEHGRKRKICPECFGFAWDGTLGCRHGLRQDYCAICDGSSLCPHSRIVSFCEDCGFRKRCPHGLARRTYCIQCNPDPSNSCPHLPNKNSCKFCTAPSTKNWKCPCGVHYSECTKGCRHPLICEHNKTQALCPICRWCRHDIRISQCKLCRDRHRTPFCRHGKHRRDCNDPSCGGTCKHLRVKRKCPICGLCPHGKRRKSCLECKTAFERTAFEKYPGEMICIHSKLKKNCEVCSWCMHKMRRQQCPICKHKGTRLKCEHGRQRCDCPHCRVCIHSLKATDCTICAPSFLEYLRRINSKPKPEKNSNGATRRHRIKYKCKHNLVRYNCQHCRICVHRVLASECHHDTCRKKFVEKMTEKFASEQRDPTRRIATRLSLCIHLMEPATCTVCNSSLPAQPSQ